MLWLRLERDRQPIDVHANRHRAAVFELSEEDLVGERIAHLALHDAAERSGAVCRVVTFGREPCSRLTVMGAWAEKRAAAKAVGRELPTV